MMLDRIIFVLRLFDNAIDHICYHNYPSANVTWELQHLQCWLSTYSNTLEHLQRPSSVEYGPSHGQIYGAKMPHPIPTDFITEDLPTLAMNYMSMYCR